MFFFSLTRSPLAMASGGRTFKAVRQDHWFCTVMVDGQLGTEVSDEVRTIVTESPSHDEAFRLHHPPYVSIRLDHISGAFEIVKAIVSGRPVYYHLSASGEFFCSTHVTLLREAGVQLEVNEPRLPEFFAYRLVTPPATLLRGIFQLLPGTSLCGALGASGCTIGTPSNHVFPATTPSGGQVSTDAVANEVLDALASDTDAFRQDRERVAVLLSGGIDSSILYRLGSTHLGTEQSFSASFTFDPRESERAYSTSAANAMGSRHRVHDVSVRDYLTSTLHGIAHAEEPLVVEHSAAFVSLFRDGIPPEGKIILQGQGADCFFGLKHHRLLRLQQRYGTLLRALSARPIHSLLSRLSAATGRFPTLVDTIDRCRGGKASVEDPRHVIWSLNQYGDFDWACRYFRTSPAELIAHRLAALQPYRSLPDLDLITVMDFISDVAALQNVWSKIGEHFGRAIHYSFCSERVIQAAARLSWDEKISQPKAVLRDVARKVGVPAFILDRRKSGFGVARRDWAVPNGIFQPLIDLAASVFPRADIAPHQTTAVPSRFTVWNIVNFAVWKRLVVDGEPLGPLEAELDGHIDEWEHRIATHGPDASRESKA